MKVALSRASGVLGMYRVYRHVDFGPWLGALAPLGRPAAGHVADRRCPRSTSCASLDATHRQEHFRRCGGDSGRANVGHGLNQGPTPGCGTDRDGSRQDSHDKTLAVWALFRQASAKNCCKTAVAGTDCARSLRCTAKQPGAVQTLRSASCAAVDRIVALVVVPAPSVPE